MVQAAEKGQERKTRKNRTQNQKEDLVARNVCSVVIRSGQAAEGGIHQDVDAVQTENQQVDGEYVHQHAFAGFVMVILTAKERSNN